MSSAESQRQDVERTIKDNEKKLTSTQPQIADTEARLEELTTNYTLTRTAYELFAKKLDEASLSVASRITELKIVDAAIIPQPPVSRHIARWTAIATALSLVTLLLLVFFLEYVKAVREVEGRV